MMRDAARGLDGRRARRLLSKTRSHDTPSARLDAASRLLLGCPYEANGLVGSAETPEVFTVSLERFDCVTYVETVLALARAERVEEFVDGLRRIRYADGRVDWRSRNHYMTGWIRNNARLGVVRPVRLGTPGVGRERRLDAVPGLPATRARFTCVPKRQLLRRTSRLATGDLVFFASTRRSLDVFHCGLLARGEDGGWRLRHATRSRGRVVEQDLEDFLRSNRMAGVIVVRPVEMVTP